VAVEFGARRIECVELAREQSQLRGEELRHGRVHQRRGAIIDPGQQGGCVDRHECADIAEHVAAKAGVGLKLDETARPQAELLGVEVERVIDIAPEIAANAAAAAHIDLRRQQQIDVEDDALFAEVVAQSAPIAGQAGSGQQIPTPGGGDRIGLRTDARWSGERSQAYQEQPGSEAQARQDPAHAELSYEAGCGRCERILTRWTRLEYRYFTWASPPE